MVISIVGYNVSDFELKESWKVTVGNIPFIGAAIWLAIFASKQRSQNKRLQEEYAFKEDVAKIYYGLKKEIEEMGKTPIGIKLNERMLEVIIEVVALNPSETLDNVSHNDKGPILEALKSIQKSIDKVG